MANSPEEFPIFTKLNKRQATLLCSKIKFYLKDFEITQGISDIDHDLSVLIEICERVEKRRIYFHIFYSCKMGELNEGALMCFWILKLTPFKHKDIPTNELNSKIALYLLNNLIFYHAKKHNKKVNIPDSVNKNLYYSFRFRDISKESIMALAESMIV